MRRIRPNPDLLGDLFIGGALIGGGYLLVTALQGLNVGGIASGAASSALTSAGFTKIPPTPVNPVASYSPGSSGTVPDAFLNASIDNWFAGASGWFGTGIASYDPTNWNAFVFAWMYPQYTLPSSPTAYFQAKVSSYYQSKGLTY